MEAKKARIEGELLELSNLLTYPKKANDFRLSLKPFLEPKSIAVLGANPNTGEQAFNVVENLANCGYYGRVYPVNPSYKEILGKKCYALVKDMPGAFQAR